MSGEQLTAKIVDKETETKTIRKNSSRVDINDLISRARQKEREEKKENYILLSIVFSVVVVTGAIALL